jgi:hypothetical protein
MAKIARYDHPNLYDCPGITNRDACEYGDWVRWEDVEHLTSLVERIEAECNNKLLCAGDLADNILAIIRAAKEGA